MPTAVAPSRRRSATSPALVAAALAVAACSFRSGHLSATFRDTRVGQARVETLDADRIAVASYKDGRLRGAEVAWELDHTWVSDWLATRTPVDHPEFAAWQSRLEKMREHAASRSPDPEPLLLAAAGFPFSDARQECFLAWVGGEPERAAQLLDRYEAADLGKAGSRQLAELAVQDPQGDDRLARWITAMARGNHKEAALVVARSPRVGPRAATAMLRELDEFSSSARRELFDAVAVRALGEPGNAGLLVAAVDELPSSDEAPAMLQLLATPHADRELAERVLRELDEFRSSDRPDLYRECARIVADDARGADALVAALSELRSADRFGAARQLLEEHADPDLVAGLLRRVGDLPSRDRPRLIEATLRQPHWNDGIERAAHDAAEKVSGRSSRERIREAIAARSRQVVR